MRKLTQYERGVRHFFGKRYMWLLTRAAASALHKVDDKGDERVKVAARRALRGQQEEQSE